MSTEIALPPLPPNVVIPDTADDLIASWDSRVLMILYDKKGVEVACLPLDVPTPLQPGIYRGIMEVDGPLPKICSAEFQYQGERVPGDMNPSRYPSIGRRDTLTIRWEIKVSP